jgi:hypothetical protein
MAATMTLIASATVGAGGASSIVFGSGGTLPQTYTDLILKWSLRTTRTGATDSFFVRLNGSTANGSERRIYLFGTTFASDSFSSTGGIDASSINASGATASTFSNSEMYIPNYTQSIPHSLSWESTTGDNTSTGNSVIIGAGLWNNATPVTSISLVPDVGTLVQYSTAYLYGVNKNA